MHSLSLSHLTSRQRRLWLTVVALQLIPLSLALRGMNEIARSGAGNDALDVGIATAVLVWETFTLLAVLTLRASALWLLVISGFVTALIGLYTLTGLASAESALFGKLLLTGVLTIAYGFLPASMYYRMLTLLHRHHHG